MITVKTFQVNPLEENCYIIHDETNEACIIDCGCLYEEEWQTIKNYIDNLHLKPVKYINTHCHFDHIFGSGMVYRDYNLKPCMHYEEVEMYLDLEGQLRAFGIASLRHSPIAPVGGQIADGDSMFFGQHILTAIHTPGHTKGGLCFYCQTEKLVFTGDTLFMESVGRTDFAGGSHEALMDSIRKKLFKLPLDTNVYSGHGTATTIGHEMEYNLYV